MPSHFCSMCKQLIVIPEPVEPGTVICECCRNSDEERPERRLKPTRRGSYRVGGRRKDD